MKVLYLTDDGLTTALAWHMLKEGHDVKFFIKDPKARKCGAGFVPMVTDWKSELTWCDYVICDYTGWGKTNDAIRKMGIPVIGGTELSDALEVERGVGQRMFKALGMETIESQEFKTIPEAIKFVSKTPDKYVVKTSGKSQGDKSLTYVGQMEDGSDIPPVLTHMASKAKGIDSVELQRVVSGIEVGIGGFFNGEEFLDPVEINWEHKKVANGGFEGGQAGMGPNTGEMGTLMLHRDKGFKLYQDTLELFVPVLKKTGYRGDFDINCILEFDPMVEGNYRIRPLEMTNRFGWPTIPLQIETMKINDLGELFHGISTGTMNDFKVTHPYSLCVVVACPPAPYASQDLANQYSEGMPVLFRNPEAMEGIYPSDVYYESGQWKCTGDMGFPVICAAGGDTIEEAKMKAYERVRNVIVPNKFYRTDIGEGCDMRVEMMKSFLSYPEILQEAVT